MSFKFLPHTADIKFQAFGKSLEECFKSASYALKQIISGGKVKNKISKKFSVKGKDKEALLYNFLEEFLFLFETKGFLLGKVTKIEIIDNGRDFKLRVVVLGDKVENYEIENHVKAITYNDMFVKMEKNKNWKIQVVVDV